MEDSEIRDILWKHMQAIETCMMVTHDGADARARPMHGMFRPAENAIWFFDDRNSEKEHEVADNAHVCLTFADTGKKVFLSISGSATRVADRARIEELWNVGAEAYFPKGRSDPAIGLIKVVPSSGEFWDAPSSPVIRAFRFVQGLATGTRPEMGNSGAAAMLG